MRHLRTLSTKALVVALAAVLAVVVGAVFAVSAAGGGGAPPPAEPLPQALLDAANAPAPDGVTARVQFTNNLLPSGSLGGEVVSPLLAGASGRLWATNDGRGRLELQANAGDVQLVWNRTDITLYDASAQSVYHAKLPAKQEQPGQDHAHAPLGLAQIEQFLAKLGAHATISPAEPGNVGGRPAYTVTLSPKDQGSLLHSLQLAWDAAHGVPLRVAVYADGMSSPVLELKVTDISYGPVAADSVEVAPPANAKKTELGGLPQRSGAREPAGPAYAGTALPDSLAGMPKSHVRASEKGKVVVYGEGLGSLVVLQHPAEGAAPPQTLATPLGTVVMWKAGGVGYVVAGSLPQSTVEAAARSLR
jgi:hypothetical protein